MRPAGALVSGIGHVGLVMLTFVAWPAATLDPVDAFVVPVEVVSIGDITNVRAIEAPAEDISEEETPAEEPVAQRQSEPEPAPAPSAQRPQPRRQQNELDLASLGDLLNDKQRPEGQRRTPRSETAERGDRARRGAGLGTAEQARLEDYIRARGDAHIGRCWRAPVDSANPERLAVIVEFDLDRQGHVRGAPRVVSPSTFGATGELRAAIDNAVRAVRACDPYPFADDPLTADHYDLWRQITYNLDPRNVGR